LFVCLGPMMVLEYCEISLKDWLGGIKSINTLNSDVLEDMSIFTMNIANGVKHLHENQVRLSLVRPQTFYDKLFRTSLINAQS